MNLKSQTRPMLPPAPADRQRSFASHDQDKLRVAMQSTVKSSQRPREWDANPRRWQDFPKQRNKAKEAILAVMPFGVEMSAAEIAEASGVKVGSLHCALGRLADAGEIVKSGASTHHRRYTRVASHEQSATERLRDAMQEAGE